jgi:hypothetical protein
VGVELSQGSSKNLRFGAAESCCSPGERVLAAASMTVALGSVILSCSLRLQPLPNLGKCFNRSLVVLRYSDVYPFP